MNEQPTGQVVARVNGREITTHQLNRLLTQSNEDAAKQRTEALERLVRRELAVEQALAMKLEREPEVMLRLEETRRETLAAIWTERLAATQPQADNSEPARYFAAHPGLFAERKRYQLRVLILPSDDTLAEKIQMQLKQGARLPDIRTWLAAEKVQPTEREITRLAEHLPIEVVDRLWQVPTGETVSFRSPESLTLYQVQLTESMPVKWKTAEPAIQDHLAKQARLATLETEMRRLRERAHIEYAPQPAP